MTHFERFVYDLVKNNPQLKDFIRNIYQGIMDILPQPKEILPDYCCEEGFFLGFHDIQPFSADNRKVLACYTDKEGEIPNAGEPMNVGYFDFDEKGLHDFHSIGTSFAWNFHKGCRLQWVDDHHLIYNTKENNVPFSVIVNINSLSEQKLPNAIDSVSVDGKWATVVSYRRIEKWMPGYGYLNVNDGDCVSNAPDSTGLSIMNLESGNTTMLLNLSDLCREVYKEDPTSIDRFHYITHTGFSRDGRYISALYRYVPTDNLDKRTSRLVIYDRQTNKHFFLPANGMVSHYAWNTNNKIVAYCRIGNDDGHVVFDINDGTCTNYRRIAPQLLNSDGHQSWVNDHCFITDTYPDKRRMAMLYLVDTISESVKQLVRIYSPKEFHTKNIYNHIACDLHPRVSIDGKYVCFDSPRTHKRSLYIIPI